MLEIGTKINAQSVRLDTEEMKILPEKGKKYILFFYPKDNTPACTAEACHISDNYLQIKSLGYEVYGVSPDSVKSHQKFKAKFNFPYPLIADEDQSLAKYFGVWDWKKFMGREYIGLIRTTFIIDEEGVISHIIDKVTTKEAGTQILELLA